MDARTLSPEDKRRLSWAFAADRRGPRSPGACAARGRRRKTSGEASLTGGVWFAHVAAGDIAEAEQVATTDAIENSV
ncbi:hypothetical protein [Virgisporangium aurantiacum]|uniref:Uncharacterized protein n=1 Tax=Virgisporangium aurantiacum TaxID=175570 RepID=A0A8J3ZID3_9ACTN|nr:hypothetical protein [Virgisporangium aurantiacum]GIJ62075.1 hypothetical protein Vau01_095910 [Virgisporangium aurantiacum]